MAIQNRMLAVGRELLARQPNITDDDLREYLKREFLVDRDLEVTLLRARAWIFAPLARLGTRILYGSRQSRELEIMNEIDLAICELRRTTLPSVGNTALGKGKG